MTAREAHHRHELRQSLKIVRDNPFGLPHETASQVVGALNQDLASMITLYQQYHKHHWIVEGAQFLELHLLLEEHYNQLHDQFDQVAERIVALGGLPVSGPAEIQEHAYIKHEDPGMFDLREMLEHDLAAEGTLASHLRQHIELASRLGDYGTEALLKAILEATEKRAAFLEKHLQEESLTRGIPAR
ncbi:DNA starvation/stationary phase protection protein DpsA [Kallotenue papyrolyticum]|uniref:DNA starvation/stationary phase protection protein DpsA n=1 Tax=Kallotenue papyrolyticum TaxID=1325125 RepID=UPI00047858A4|nr:DNA starvation/stationary phase protection protein DpsA [Kallotenue papyrolyticum]